MTQSGLWSHNVETGEIARLVVTPEDGQGDLLEAELWLMPGAAVVGEHVHDTIAERFEVVEGRVGFRIDGVEREGGPGTVVEVPPGVAHDWWNAGGGKAFVRVRVEPATRFIDAIEALFSLANTGRTGRGGRPGPLWGAAVAHEYRDVLHFTRPPLWLQRLLIPPLAALARRLGRDPRDPSLHGPDCPARLFDPPQWAVEQAAAAAQSAPVRSAPAPPPQPAP